MSYTPHTPKAKSRPFRIIFGTLLIACGLVAGTRMTVHEFHRASISQGQPVEMDWDTLVEHGFGDHPHIRLVNVDVIDDPSNQAHDVPEGDQQNLMMDVTLLRNRIMNSDGASARVVPVGGNAWGDDNRVQIAEGNHYFAEATRQVSETNSIEGIVSTYRVGQMISDLFLICNSPSIASLQSVDFMQTDRDLRYTIVPIEGTPDLSKARNLYMISGFSLALGMILCGSGGPGLWCWFYNPLPSLISMIGYPMRYGRGNWTTRVAYIFVGIAMMGGGYFLLVHKANFGIADGNPILHSLGFASLFIGLGGVLAVPFQITTRALGQKSSVHVEPSAQPARMTWNQACSMEPITPEVDYEDDELASAGSIPLNCVLKEMSDELEAIGFTTAESMLWRHESSLAAAALQLGCEMMVVSDLESEYDSGIVQASLISVLATGIPVITVSANSDVKQNRPHAKCLFQIAQSSDPIEMLAEHLEVVVGEAKSRDTVVVELHPSEIYDLAHLSRRVLAELQGTMDDLIINIGPKRYGRFHCPPAPVSN